MRKIDCLRCKVQMNHIGTEKLQLGQTGWLLGDLPNLLAGALEVELYSCPQCGKLELFNTSSGDTEATGDTGGSIPQRKCPRCGKTHDFDYPKCPFCKFDYNAK